MKKIILSEHIKQRIQKQNFESFNWRQNIDDGIIIENVDLGFQIKYYGIFDNNNLLYDTIGISERSENCIVVIVNQDKKIGLIHEYRPIPDREFIACVRGFAEYDESSSQTAIREFIEETGETRITNIKFLNSFYQNPTFFETSINVFMIKIVCYNSVNVYKKPNSTKNTIHFYDLDEILFMIKHRKIQCQMTLSALMIYLSYCHFN